ncbi:MAG: DUF2079 domain-containing protein [Candidatus Omnitrophota bacterium]
MSDKASFRGRGRWAGLCAGSFIFAYVFVFYYLSYLKYTSFTYNDFDLAINAQILWNMGQGSLYNSILGTSFLGNHLHFVLFLILPVYKIFPSPLTLLFLQALALGLSAWPLFLLARRVLGPGWAVLSCFAYLFYPPLAYVNLFEFHPVVFSTLFLSFMLYFYHKRSFAPFALFMFLAMACQENIPLAVAALGVCSLVSRRPKRWVYLPLICGGAYFLAAVFILLPRLSQNKLQFINLYGHLGRTYPQIALNILIHPIMVAKILFSGRNLLYLLKLFTPLSFIPLLSPLALAAAAPFFLQHMLSQRPNETFIYYHYTAELIPFIFVAFVLGLARVKALCRQALARRLVGLGLVAICVGGSLWLGPHFSLGGRARQWRKDTKDGIKEYFLQKISRDDSLVATFEFLPFLAHRRDLYSFHHVYMGRYTMSRRPYKLPQGARYALLDFSDYLTFKGFFSPRAFENLDGFLRGGQWGLVESLDSFVLLERKAGGRPLLYGVSQERPQPKHNPALKVGETIEFIGYDVTARRGRLEVVFYWHCLRRPQRDISLFFHLVDDKGRVIYKTTIPLCWRAYPTTAWRPGEYIWDRKVLPLFSPTGKKAATWKMGAFDFSTGQLIPLDKAAPLGRIDIRD